MKSVNSNRKNAVDVGKHNWGVDLLKIVSTYFVVMLHILGQGGIISASSPLTINYEIAWFLEIGSYCAVNCYALISGYIGYARKFKYQNILKLYLQVIFYTTIITTLFAVVCPSVIGVKDFVKALFPFAFKQYWYFTAYFCVFFFIPFLGILVDKLDKRQTKKLIATIGFLFCVLPTIFQHDLFYTKAGYSPLWLAALYIIGAYIKKYDIAKNKSKKFCMGIYFGCIVLTWLFKFVIELFTSEVFGKVIDGSFLVSYVSPTILLSAIMLLIWFSQIEIKKAFKKFVSVFAPASFGVYLIHTHPLIWERIMGNRFSNYIEHPPIFFLLCVLGTSIVVLLICSLIDIIRIKLFEMLKMKVLVGKISQHMKLQVLKYCKSFYESSEEKNSDEVI